MSSCTESCLERIGERFESEQGLLRLPLPQRRDHGQPGGSHGDEDRDAHQCARFTGADVLAGMSSLVQGHGRAEAEDRHQACAECQAAGE